MYVCVCNVYIFLCVYAYVLFMCTLFVIHRFVYLIDSFRVYNYLLKFSGKSLELFGRKMLFSKNKFEKNLKTSIFGSLFLSIETKYLSFQ